MLKDTNPPPLLSTLFGVDFPTHSRLTNVCSGYSLSVQDFLLLGETPLAGHTGLTPACRYNK